jgi:enoyl-CoA hydratase/carnithine racemase
LLDECDLPSVAVVRGYAYAGGFTLAMGGKFARAGQSLKKKGAE